MSEKNTVIMEVKNINLRFGGVIAIQDVSFNIFEGEIRAIIGPNGAGKSSMLNVINGFYHPQEGEVWFNGEKRPSMEPYQIAKTGIARTFQNIALFKGMTTIENVMTGRQLKMNKNFFWQMLRYGPAIDEEVQHRRRCEEIIDFLEINHIRKTPVGSLPYGLQKRVELARALAMDPKILLLDEPMAGLGPSETQEMIALLNKLKGKQTILLIEHDMDAVFALADRISVLVSGEIIATGEPNNIRRDSKVQNAYLGEA